MSDQGILVARMDQGVDRISLTSDVGDNPALAPRSTPRSSAFLKALRVVRTGSAFLIFWTVGALISWFAIPVLTLYYRGDQVVGQRRARSLVSSAFRWFIDYVRWMRLMAFDARSIEAQLPRGAFVLVANHPTLIDVILLLASYPSLCCVAKGHLFSSPLIGRVLRRSGHINAGNGGTFAGTRVALEAIERLAAGDPVLIFPEATRSPANGLGPFKRGAFAIATKANVPLVSIRIRACPATLMKGMAWYAVPDGLVSFEMAVLKTIDPASYAGDDKSLAADVWALFARGFGEPRPTGPMVPNPAP
jgi:1-acyl-sn-glycerol-3-phosphate acyltransferase